jgi:TPR repeat protein/exonuclease VII small subunit
MAKTASSDKRDRSRPWQRAATRAAILEATRRLVARTGIDNLSLTAVAREAEFAPATVFAYFSSKNDLFLSVLADDLAAFARTMRERDAAAQGIASPPLADIPRVERVDETASTAVEPDMSRGVSLNRLRLVETQDDVLDAFVADDDELASQSDIASGLMHELNRLEDVPLDMPHSRSTSAVESPVPAANGELARLQEAVARLESRPVDQWLERRLREFERGLAALEQRSEKTEVAAALAGIDDTLRALAARLDGFEARQAKDADTLSLSVRDRAEQAERRFRDLASDVEAANARTNTRLVALENAAFAAAPEFFHVKPQLEPVAVHPVAASVAGAHDDAIDQPEQLPPAVVTDSKTFLSAARRSAQAAAEQGQTEERHGRRSRGMSKRALYLIAGGMALIVALIWTGVFVKAAAIPNARATSARMSQASPFHHVAAPAAHASRLQAAAEAGDPRAALVVALKLLDGPQKNDAVAARWLTLSAQRNDAVAAFKLATLYRVGRGVKADATQAFRWFLTAAHEGNCKAMQDLAVAYAEGWGTAKDPSEAARWFSHAASLGLTDAQFNLGVLYEQGLGVPQSLPDAYKWYLVAAAAGDREAQTRVEAIKPELDSSNLAAAEEEAASFKAAPLNQDANVAPVAAQAPAG